MKQSTKRLLSSVVALLLVVGAGVVFFNLIQPAYHEVSRLQGEVASRRQLVNDQQAIIEQVKKLRDAYEQDAARRTAIGETLPVNPDVAGAIAQLAGLARLNDLDPVSFSVSLPSVQSATGKAGTLVRPLGIVDIRTQLTGSYGNFKQFLANLEKNIRLMDAEELGVASAGKPTQDLYVYDLTVATYYQTQ